MPEPSVLLHFFYDAHRAITKNLCLEIAWRFGNDPHKWLGVARPN